MTQTPPHQDPVRDDPRTLTSPWLDLAVRLALIAGLLGWSFTIVRPFLSPIIWGAVLAVAVCPLFDRVNRALGGRTKTTAVLFVVVPMLLFSTPLVVLAESLVNEVLELNESYKAGTLAIPAPSEKIAELPFLGKRLYALWSSAHSDLAATIQTLTPQLLELRTALVGFARGMAAVLVTLFFSLIIMAIFLATADNVGRTVRGLSVRVAGSHGDPLVSLARDTTRSVAKGVVGVAVIQAILGGLGCFAAGVPASGIWTVAILVLAVAQLPPLLVLGPVAVYVFSQDSMLTGVLFGIWAVLVGLIDNVLKPLLLGKGLAAPMLVVFLGAIGGMLSSGVLGLFVGPVVLVVTFTLVRSWANLAPRPPGTSSSGDEPQPAPSSQAKSIPVLKG